MELDKLFVTVLWTDDDKFDIKSHETLQEAVVYLVKNGANYEHQEIVKKVDWLPNSKSVDGLPKEPSQKIADPEEEALANKPNPSGPPLGQPNTLNPSNDMTGKKSIFDGIIPPQLRGPILSDD